MIGKRETGKLVQDDFSHEQCLVVTQCCFQKNLWQLTDEEKSNTIVLDTKNAISLIFI